MPKKLSTSERAAREGAACREAGHAVAAHEHSIMVHSLSVRNVNRDVGRNVWNDPLRNVDFEWVRSTDSEALVERLAAALIAGPVAQRVFVPRLPRGVVYTKRVAAVRTLLNKIDGGEAGKIRFEKLKVSAERFFKRANVGRAVQALSVELVAAGQMSGEDAVRIIDSCVPRAKAPR